LHFKLFFASAPNPAKLKYNKKRPSGQEKNSYFSALKDTYIPLIMGHSPYMVFPPERSTENKMVFLKYYQAL